MIIDALGMDHYIDKFHATREPNSSNATWSFTNDQIVLVNVLRRLLTRRRVTVYVSKCALYGEVPLHVRWPFSKAGVPRVPQEFMPEVWKSAVSFTVLLYFLAQSEEGEGGDRRGIVVVRRGRVDTRREGVVSAAGVLEIGITGVVEVEECVHIVE